MSNIKVRVGDLKRIIREAVNQDYTWNREQLEMAAVYAVSKYPESKYGGLVEFMDEIGAPDIGIRLGNSTAQGAEDRFPWMKRR